MEFVERERLMWKDRVQLQLLDVAIFVKPIAFLVKMIEPVLGEVTLHMLEFLWRTPPPR